MPATETQTPAEWAHQFGRNNFDSRNPRGAMAVAELADLKRRADQAERLAAVLRETLPYLQHLATTAPVGSDAERVAEAIESALGASQ